MKAGFSDWTGRGLLAGAPAGGGPHPARAGSAGACSATRRPRPEEGLRSRCPSPPPSPSSVRRHSAFAARRRRPPGRRQPDRPHRSPHRRHAHLERARPTHGASSSSRPRSTTWTYLNPAVVTRWLELYSEVHERELGELFGEDAGCLPARRAVGAARRHHLLAVPGGAHQGRPRLRSPARDRGAVPGHRPRAPTRSRCDYYEGGGRPAGGAASTGRSAAGTRSAACASRPSPRGAGRASWARRITTSTASATSGTSTSPATRTRWAPRRATAAWSTPRCPAPSSTSTGASGRRCAPTGARAGA